MTIKALAVLPGLIPSTIIDVVTPLRDLHKAGLIDAKISIERFVKKRDIDWCDIIILCRNIHPDTARWFLYALNIHRPYIYDIDDNFFAIPRGTPLADYHKEPSRQKMLKEYIKLADLVRVYSVPMLLRVQKINSNVEKVVAPIDLRLINSPNRFASDIIRIVYATSRSEDKLSNIFKPALKKVLEEFPQVRVYFLGHYPEGFDGYPNVFHQSLVFDYQSFLRSFSDAGYDIGLAPLLNDVFHRSKTNNKFREYGASQIAGIYSNVEVYSSCVEHEKTGLLVENESDAWFYAMKTLIEKPLLRSDIQKSAFDFVKINYSQENFNDIWYKQIERALSKEKHNLESTKKVEELIKQNTNPSLYKQIKLKISNHIKMYWVFVKLRLEFLFMRREKKSN
jgi:glycosyltransferase involved in cell wall biosynthesis